MLLPISLKKLSVIFLMGTVLGLTACEKSSKTVEQNSEISSDDQIMKELNSDPIKNFAKTPDDLHDLTLLTQYDESFSQISDEMEDELMKLREEGKLTDEFSTQRKRDNIQSALNMLKELEMKTEQGRYIQGLMYQYWDNQSQIYREKNQTADGELKNPSDSVKGLGQFIHAQEQLGHWQEQYPELKHPAQAQ